MNHLGRAWAVFACMALCLYCSSHKTATETDPAPTARESPKPADAAARPRNAGGSDLPSLEILDLKRVGRYLRGTVKDDQGRPLTGILIKAKGPDGAPPYTAASKNDGSFFVMAPAGQAYVLIIDNPHFQKLHLRLRPDFGVSQR